MPIVAWQDRFFVRVSIQAYNSPRDVDRLLDGLARLLKLACGQCRRTMCARMRRDSACGHLTAPC